ncbi:MAG: LuxR C-terminal-related transcriptional regulator, partial [Chloroflexi bacterium]|nr:LuxR C-terminal-related transcriptional regulator [Chloroflexota bacterium]
PDLEPPTQIEPEQARFRLFDSITTFLKRASEGQPIVLVLDNLHWADASSLRLLEFMAQETSEARLLVIGTYRDVDVARGHPLYRALGELARLRGFQRVLMRGLSQEEVGRVIEGMGGVRPSERLAQRVQRETEGNPLFVGEIVRWLAQEGRLASEDWSASGGRLPEGVREVIGRRLDSLSDECNEALRVASLIGREFSLKQLEKVMESASSSIQSPFGKGGFRGVLADALDEAVSARMLEETPKVAGLYQFSHALVRQTLESEFTTTRRVQLHARIIEAFEELYEDELEAHADELARHAGEAEAVIGPDKLVRYSAMAGERAMAAYAYEEALAHFQRALESRGDFLADAEVAAILFGLGRAYAATFQYDEAVAHLNSAFDAYLHSGDIAGALAVAKIPDTVRIAMHMADVIERALTLVPPDSHEAGQLLSNYSYALGTATKDYDRVREAVNRAIVIARREGDLVLEMRTLANAANVEGWQLHPQESLDYALQAVELSRHVIDLRSELIAHLWAGYSLVNFGRPVEAQRHVDAMRAIVDRAHQNHVWFSRMCNLDTILCYLRGDWVAVRNITDRILALGPRESSLVVRRALLEYELGNFMQGEPYVQTLEELSDPSLAYIAIPIAVISHMTGGIERLEIARRFAETSLSSTTTPPIHVVCAHIALGLVAVQRKDTVEAATHYAALASEKGMSYHSIIGIDRVLGLLVHTMGNLDKAAGHFEGALAFCRKAGYRPELAWTCYDYANLLHEQGQRQKALALLDEALSISTELGMKPLMEKVIVLKEQVEAEPVTVPVYPDGLTEREVDVLRLIAAGKSNREIGEELFITSNTVARHVSNIFAKIGASNRAEAASYATRHGLA